MAPNIVKLVKRQAERVPDEAQPTIAAPKIFGHHTPHAKWPVTEAPTEGKTKGNHSRQQQFWQNATQIYMAIYALCFKNLYIFFQ